MEENNEVIKNNDSSADKAGKKNNNMALTSFILGLVSLLIAGIPLGIAAVVTGSTALAKFNPETEKNKWMAIAGIIIGIIGAVSAAILIPQVLKDMKL